MIRATAAAVQTATPVKYFLFTGTAGERITTPDAAVLDITGDIDIRARVASITTNGAVASKFLPAGDQRSYEFTLVPTLTRLSGTWSTTGANFPGLNYNSWDPGTQGEYVRATRATATGERIIYTSTDGASWTSRASFSGDAGALYAGTAELAVGSRSGGIADVVTGRIYWVEVRNGIDGTVVARMDASDAVDASTAWTGSVDGLTWTPQGAGLTLVTE